MVKKKKHVYVYVEKNVENNFVFYIFQNISYISQTSFTHV